MPTPQPVHLSETDHERLSVFVHRGAPSIPSPRCAGDDNTSGGSCLDAAHRRDGDGWAGASVVHPGRIG
jgi:hypothetical protein